MWNGLAGVDGRSTPNSWWRSRFQKSLFSWLLQLLLPPHYDQRTELQLFLCIQTETGPSLSQPVLRKKLDAETQILFLRILYIIIPWSVVVCLTCCWTNSGIASTSRMKLNFKTVRPFKELSFRILKGPDQDFAELYELNLWEMPFSQQVLYIFTLVSSMSFFQHVLYLL